MLVGVGDEGAFEGIVDDGLAGADLIEEFLEAGDGRHLGEGAADDLFGFEAEEGGLAIVEAKVAVVVEVEEREADGGGAIDGFELGVLALGFEGFVLEGFAIDLLGGEVAEEDDDAVFGGIALDAEPDVKGLGIEGFELGGKALVHAAAVGLYVGRACVDGGGEDFEEVSAGEVEAHGDDLLCTAIQEGEAVVAIEETDRIGGGLEKLLHLPQQGRGFTIGAGWESRQARSLNQKTAVDPNSYRGD